MRIPIAVALAFASSIASAAPRGKVAVTEVRSVQGVAPGTATILSDIVVSEVARAGYEVISQADITAMIGFERQKKVLGCSDDSSCLAEIGGALGVDFMLAGQVGQIGTRYRISLLLVDSKKAKVVARSAQFCEQNEDALARAAEATVQELLASARAASPAAQAAAKPPEPAKDAPAKVAAGKEAAPSLEAKPSAAAPKTQAISPAGAVSTTAGPGFFHSRKAAYWTMGTGGGLVLVGLLLGGVAQSRYDDLEARQGDLGYYDDYLAEKKGIRRLAITADAMMVTGLAVAGTGGWMWWRSGHARVAVAPAATPGGAALVAAGRF